MPRSPGAFAFGQNWQRFIAAHIDEDRIGEAEKSLQQFMKMQSLKGLSFIDIGCGSGLFSLAAYRLGAKNIVSVDYDADSVACTKALREKAGNPAHWQVLEGSVLDTDFLSTLGTFDCVYSWGVLHHTGKMWQAIENTLALVAPKGLCYIAIYNKTDEWGLHPDGRFGSSKFWEHEKKMYVALPRFLQRCIDGIAMGGMILLYLLTLRNPARVIRNHRTLRGMAWSIDITDWLGGYPYEYATVAEIFRFVHEKGFDLENLISNNGLLNNEFLLRRR